MLLKDWAQIKYASFIDKQAERFLDEEIIKEVSSVNMEWEELLKGITRARSVQNTLYPLFCGIKKWLCRRV